MTTESDGDTTTFRFYTKKVSGVTYAYLDSEPFIGDSVNSETLDMTEFIQDGAEIGYTSDFLTIVGFETLTGDDGSEHYVAKVLDNMNTSDTVHFYVGETFWYLGGITGDDESSPDSTTELSSFTP